MSIPIYHSLDADERPFGVIFREFGDIQLLEDRIDSAITVADLEGSISDAGLGRCDNGHAHYGGVSILDENTGRCFLLVRIIFIKYMSGSNFFLIPSTARR